MGIVVSSHSRRVHGLQRFGVGSMSEPPAIRRSDRRFSRGCSLLLLAMAFLLPPGMVCGKSTPGQAGSTFSRLVQMVAESGENAQQDFAWIALAELIAAYEKVYLSSRTEQPKERKARDKLINWRNGTQRYISELHALLDRLPGSVELQMQAGEAGPPVIYIDGEPLVLSGPEIGSAMRMEKRIIDIYCAMYDCSELSSSAGQQSTEIMAPGRGIWNLGNSGKVSYATPDGLIFIFSGISGRQAKQQSCEALAAEMRRLVAGLREAVDAGHPVDWMRLEIQPLAGNRGHRTVFNSAGEYLRMALPGLARLGALSPGILSWIQQRTIGGTPAEAEIFADLLLLESGGFELE